MQENKLKVKYIYNSLSDLQSNKSLIKQNKPSNLLRKESELFNKEIKFQIKKKGRKKNIPSNSENQIIEETDSKDNVHNKYSHDNIKRRIKVLFNNYIIELLNKLMKQKYKNIRHKFLKMNARMTKDIGIEYNRNLLNTPLKEIIVNISDRYQNKDNNNANCIKFIKKQNDNEEIINILNMTYEELYVNYLKSTKNDSLENSFEAHKEKMMTLYGKEYLDKFIENTKNFIEFFKNGKQRKSRKEQEVDYINIHFEENQDNIIENIRANKNMVSSYTQTDLYDINSKIIAIF